ncbi:5-hydroxytryptamine receptor 3A-like isoform 1-T1 [Anomaloglossus baeobatrachus]|uniref:5-hydroxytryptamine receptor 3A-like isoform X1 n=1 Tax=Anomaloglossus baeobatrachus TaxID=238106 RepID=UPI003F5001E0
MFSFLNMSPHSLTLLLTCTLFGVNYCYMSCSFERLMQNLSFPNPNVRPVRNWTTVTEVSIKMTLYTVVKLETSIQTLSTLVWFNMQWKNEFIGWDPNQFCSIREVFTSNDTFWKPDMYISEMVDSEDKSPVLPFYSIDYTGNIKMAHPLKIISSCKLKTYNFPFDTQKCNLTFGSYIYPAEEIVMLAYNSSSEVFQASREAFVNKGDWILKNITVEQSSLNFEDTNYSTVYYEITLQRIPIVYVITLIVPACFLVILDIVSMFIQMDSKERLGFKITIVLGFSVLLLILNSMLPSSEKSPVLGIFCCVCMAVMVISIFGCIAVSYMLALSESQPTVPLWVKSWILKYLACILFFRRESFMKYGITPPDTYDNTRALEEQRLEAKKKTERDKEDRTEVKMLKMLQLQVKNIHNTILVSRETTKFKTEWHAAALVVDRLVLIIYLCIVVILFVVVFIIWFI